MTEILSLTCSCHVIDPNKSPILVWMRNGKPLVKIADQFFLGQTRIDKKGETYWKCKDFVETILATSDQAKELNSVEKFQARQEQVNNSQIKENDSKPNTEININS